MRPHRNVLLALADELRRMGGYVDVERYCADLHFPGWPCQWKLDVTIRWGACGNAANVPGLAAAAGVAAKKSRHGGDVRAISCEPLGRMAAASADHL